MRQIYVSSHRRKTAPAVALLAITALACGSADSESTIASSLATSAAPGSCANPAGRWERRHAADLGMDARKLQEAIDWATPQTSLSVAVYRHGCLAGESHLDEVTRSNGPS